MYEGPEFRHIISFLAIAEEHSFIRAAKVLHTSQPSLSAQIRQLEEGLSVHLFRRTRVGAELTEHGRIFLKHARKMLQARVDCVRETSPRHAHDSLPFRLGYSPFVNHTLAQQALIGYREIVPEGRINAYSECTARIMEMVERHELDAGLISLPIQAKQMSENKICQERVMLCMRQDSPFALPATLRNEEVSERLKVMVSPSQHPELYSRFKRKFKNAGIALDPTEFVSAPGEVQFLVKTLNCFGLIRESAPIDSDLVKRSIPNLDLSITTALVYRTEQQSPVLSLLALRLAQSCLRSVVPCKKQPMSADDSGQQSGIENAS